MPTEPPKHGAMASLLVFGPLALKLHPPYTICRFFFSKYTPVHIPSTFISLLVIVMLQMFLVLAQVNWQGHFHPALYFLY